MTKDLKWRLSTLPDAEEVAALVEQKVITAKEARGILFREGDDPSEKIKNLEEEVEFLRKLVETLSKNRGGSYTIHYPQWIESKPWWGPTYTYMSTANSNINLAASTTPKLGTFTTTSGSTGMALGQGATAYNLSLDVNKTN